MADLASVLADGELFHDRKGRVRPLPVPLAPLADTHGHLTCLSHTDPAEALARAALAGVRLLVLPMDPVADLGERWATAAELMGWVDEQLDRARGMLDDCASRGLVPPAFPDHEDAPALLDGGVRIVAGVHPYGAAEYLDGTSERGVDVRRELEVLLSSDLCVGVGEIGLDYGPYNECDPALQEAAFRDQLRIARERDLPAELHVRDAADDPAAAAHALAARILAEDGVPARGCDLHCYTSGPEVLAPFADLGCHAAFGGVSTFGRSDDVRDAACDCPPARLLTETDCPYMAPVPLRGEECEPAMVAFTAANLALVREERGLASRGQTYAQLWANARALFGV